MEKQVREQIQHREYQASVGETLCNNGKGAK